jgi:hypothetical protein
MASYDQLIPPEVYHDGLYRLIESVARRKDVRTILEIGSSSGEGSTAAFVNGMKRNPNRPMLFCTEISRVRFAALQKRYCGRGDVQCYNVSTVSPEDFPTEAEVAAFYRNSCTALNRYPLDQVLEWLRQDLDYITKSQVEARGIQLIKEQHGISHFDVVLIDGSAFTGFAELDEVYGSRIILLDDINDIKNLQSYRRLASDPQYQLMEANWNLRNGYAAFKRKTVNGESKRFHFSSLLWPFKSAPVAAVGSHNALRPEKP